ncbi:MAG: sulfatase [Verrucomicrobia bacterium]|nr:sulfatase [Verrucomicrobiota bacterium]
MKIPIRFLATASFVLVLTLTANTAAAAASRKPNIIFILADDLGWTDLGIQGSKYYESPNIDRLASQGMLFTNYHNCQNCAPTRAALMSGQYGPRTGVYTVGGIDRFNWRIRPLRPVDNVQGLPLEKITVAQALKSAGYTTAIFGKWHLGEKDEFHPSKRGFDEAITTMGKHFDFNTQPKVDYPKGAYLADWLTDKSVDFIKRHKDKPFFLYLAHFGVHSPHDAKKELIEKFKPKPGVGGHNNPTYAAMIYSVDESVGRVMATLDALKLADNTVLIFASDNGGVGGYDREGITKAGGITDNAPLRSGKGSLYEGGTRVPFVARWPGVTKPGSTCGTPAIHVDLYPTFLDIAGAKPPANYPLDGESLVPLLKQSGPLKREVIFHHFPGYLGAGANTWRTTPVGVITAGDWKLMEFFEDSRLELYNLKDDLSEKTSLATTMPEKAKELHEKLVAWRKSVNAPMPTPNKPDNTATEGKKKGRGKGKKRATE